MSEMIATQSESGVINQVRGDQFNNSGSGDVYHAQSMSFAITVDPRQLELQDCLSTLFQTLRSDPRDDRELLTQRKGTRVDGTCQWIKTDSIYQSWVRSDSASDDSAHLLWISGGPGTGKTMLSIYLSEELERVAKEEVPDSVFMGFFCDNKDDKRNTGGNIIRGLVFQLLLARPTLSRHIIPTFEIQKSSLFADSSIESLWGIFKSMISDQTIGTAYCVLDGLDECNEVSLETVLKRLKAISSVCFNFRIVIVSREFPECISHLLSGFPRIQLDSDTDNVKRDINRFIDFEVDDLASYRQYPKQLHLYVKKTFQDRAQGTFLWVGFVAKILRRYKATEVEKALVLFPPGLEEIYTRMLLQIDVRRRGTTAQMLNYIVAAVRPLSLSELTALLEPLIENSSLTHFHRKDVVREYISGCGYFLTIRDEQVSLIHQSAKEYLQSKNRHPELGIFFVQRGTEHVEIAKRCFYYLHNGSLAGGPIDLMNDSLHLEAFPLLSYAVLHWPDHAKSLPFTENIFDLSLPFYGKDSLVRRAWTETCRSAARYRYSRPPESSQLLHLACYFGILPLVQKLLSPKGIWAKIRRPYDLEETENSGKTPLHIAASLGFTEIARLLLEKGAYVEAIDHAGDTALHKAACYGHTDMIRLLLEEGNANINAPRKGDMATALQLAFELSQEAAVRVLLEKGADIEVKDLSGSGKLHLVILMGNTVLMRLLFNKRPDLDTEKNTGKKGIHFPAKLRSLPILLVLLDRNVDIKVRDGDGSTTLHLAANVENPQEDKLNFLIEQGLDVRTTDYRGRTALHLAMVVRPASMMFHLRDAGFYGRSIELAARHFAAEANRLEVVRLLLKEGANLEAKDSNGRTALHLAVDDSYEYEATVRLLIKEGADAGARDDKGLTALQIAKEKKHEAIIRLLAPPPIES